MFLWKKLIKKMWKTLFLYYYLYIMNNEKNNKIEPNSFLDNNTRELWKILSNNIDYMTAKTLFHDELFIMEKDDTKIVLQFHSSNVYEFVKENEDLYAILINTIKEIWGNQIKIIFLDPAEKTQELEKEIFKDFKDEKDFKTPMENIKIMEIKDSFKHNSLSKYKSLKSYVKTGYNEEAYNVAMQIIQNPKQVMFSPFFIHSKSGLGKTHLINGIGNELVKAGESVLYIDPHFFLKVMVPLLKDRDVNAMNEILDYITLHDVLIFDDIQFYGNKEATAHLVFVMMDNHIKRKKQIIISSDRDPDSLGDFENRFVTRFKQGIVTELKTPSSSDLEKILLFKINQEGMASGWDYESLNFLIENYRNSIRELEGALNRIKLYTISHRDESEYKITVIKNIFKDVIDKNQKLTPDRIIKTVSEHYKIKEKDILGVSRKKEIVTARSVAIFLIRSQLKITYKQIGALFGGKDHSTILAAYEKIEKLSNETNLRNTLNTLKQNIVKSD